MLMDYMDNSHMATAQSASSSAAPPPGLTLSAPREPLQDVLAGVGFELKLPPTLARPKILLFLIAGETNSDLVNRLHATWLNNYHN